jgi:cyclomaltodextrinase
VTGPLLDRVWYHLFPLGALGAERHNPSPGAPGGTVEHRLRALVPRLDELADLGVGGLLLGPVFESGSHGYDTVDPFRIDRRLGDEADLRALADACHERGVALGLDGVFHHVGRGHPRFREVLADGPASPSARWFHIDPAAPGPDGFGYADFEGHAQLVKLNHQAPEVQAWAADVVRFWQDRGVDAWRIDAAYALRPDFLAGLGAAARAHKPGTVLVGEVIHGNYGLFGRAARLDAVTQYELWKAVWSSLNDRNLFELAHALERHGHFAAEVRPWTFVGNHDTTRLASRLDDPRHVGHAVALLLTLPGTPAIYAGDEVGATGVKRDEEWGDDDVRRPVPALPPDGPGRELWDLHRRLIAVRRAHPWLATATVAVEELANEHATIRLHAGDRAVRLTLVLGDGPTSAPAGTVLAGSDGPSVPSHAWTLRRAD